MTTPKDTPTKLDELKVYHIICEDGIRRELVSKQAITEYIKEKIPAKKNHRRLSTSTAFYMYDKGYDQAIDDFKKGLGL